MNFRTTLIRSSVILALIGAFFFLCATNAYSQNQHKKEIEITRHEDRPVVEVRTELANYLFSTEDGSIRSIFLHFASYGSKQAELVSGTATNPETMERSYDQDAVFPGQLTSAEEDQLPSSYQVQLPSEKKYDQATISFVGETDDLRVEKTYVIHNNPNYTIELDISLTNLSEEPLTMGDDNRLIVDEIGARESTDDVSYLSDPNVRYIFDGEVSNSILASGSYEKFGGAGLVGEDLVFFFKNNTQKAIKTTPNFSDGVLSFNLGEKELGAGDAEKHEFTIYGGRRRHVLLSNVGLASIDEIGLFSKLLVPVIGFLNQLYKWTGNYGWAIIMFTVLIRILLYPLMKNMYRSMGKMQELQPKMEEIREEYEDDRQKQQEAMMELYKEEGVNPMGGCLPMFIQLPILILLWRAILYSAEQIHLSPGFLWLNDLSLHDPYYILVALTVGIMIVQQQLMQTPGGGGGQNKWMGLVFPLFMGVMLHNFPAGLWLYYFLTTLFQVGQQSFINWEMEKQESEAEAT